MAADRWRLFVAVPIGEGLRSALASSVASWEFRPDLDGLRWTDPAAWHVTLHFIGATDVDQVPRIVAALAGVAACHEPMRLATGGIGGFPSATRARVAWYGVADPERRLRQLAEEIRSEIGAKGANRFRAHVTLARARSEPVDLRPWIADASPPTGSLEVTEIHLMRTHLGGGPARYEAIARLRLGGAARA